MGVWSHQPFGNDTASDWAYGLDTAQDLSYTESTMDKVLAPSEYVEAADAEAAVAAVEVLAKLLGRGTQVDTYTEAVDAWVVSMPQTPTRSLLEKAEQTLERILSQDSESLELWAETADFAAWQESLAILRAAIRP